MHRDKRLAGRERGRERERRREGQVRVGGSPSDEAHDLAISHISQSPGGPARTSDSTQAPGRGKHENCMEEMFLNNIPLLSSDLIGSYWIISDEGDISNLDLYQKSVMRAVSSLKNQNLLS